jgi:hypothetical protein
VTETITVPKKKRERKGAIDGQAFFTGDPSYLSTIRAIYQAIDKNSENFCGWSLYSPLEMPRKGFETCKEQSRNEYILALFGGCNTPSIDTIKPLPRVSNRAQFDLHSPV